MCTSSTPSSRGVKRHAADDVTTPRAPSPRTPHLAGSHQTIHVDDQIAAHLATLPDATRNAMRTLHDRVVELLPRARRWFLDGTDDTGRVVSNPSIGHGSYSITYADGRSREFYQVGLSANTRGLSVYLMGLSDRAYLARTYGATIGKATVTGYCISFRRLEQIDLGVLDTAILDAVARTSS